MVLCLERDADLHMAQLMLLPLTVSCFSEIQIGFTFLVLADPGSPGQRVVKPVLGWWNKGHVNVKGFTVSYEILCRFLTSSGLTRNNTHASSTSIRNVIFDVVIAYFRPATGLNGFACCPWSQVLHGSGPWLHVGFMSVNCQAVAGRLRTLVVLLCLCVSFWTKAAYKEKQKYSAQCGNTFHAHTRLTDHSRPSWSSNILINFLHLLWSNKLPPWSIYLLDSPFWQPLSRFSLVFLLVWNPLLHTPYISSPNHLLFATYAHTIR